MESFPGLTLTWGALIVGLAIAVGAWTIADALREIARAIDRHMGDK